MYVRMYVWKSCISVCMYVHIYIYIGACTASKPKHLAWNFRATIYLVCFMDLWPAPPPHIHIISTSFLSMATHGHTILAHLTKEFVSANLHDRNDPRLHPHPTLAAVALLSLLLVQTWACAPRKKRCVQARTRVKKKFDINKMVNSYNTAWNKIYYKSLIR